MPSMCITCKMKYACWNYKDEQKPLYCASCKLENMTDIKNNKCIKCDVKRAAYNYPNEKESIVL